MKQPPFGCEGRWQRLPRSVADLDCTGRSMKRVLIAEHASLHRDRIGD